MSRFIGERPSGWGSVALARFLVGWCAAALAWGCASEDIVAASLPPGGEGGAPSPAAFCTRDADCGADAFCATPDCGASRGRCAVRPVVCEPNPAPACGCDGVTYWNDCGRRAAGVRASVPGECSLEARRACAPGSRTCPVGTFCALLNRAPRGEHCGPPAPGSCWSVPAACPADVARDWAECGEALPDDRCVDLCSAIRSQRPHARSLECR
jgi:hypothetical protein